MSALVHFARAVTDYLEGGNPEEALRICREGVARFPGYTTGHLVLGRCYESLGRPIEALVAYRRVRAVLPDNPTVGRAVQRMESVVEKDYQAFSSRRGAPAPGQRGTRTLEGFLSGGPARSPQHPDDRNVAAPIVTPTLAEIYAAQGQYGEAVQTYQRLVAQRPEEEEHYRERITALEKLREQQEGNTPS